MKETALHSGNLIVNKQEFRFDLKINQGRITYIKVLDQNDIPILWYEDDCWMVPPGEEESDSFEILRLLSAEFGGG